VTCSLPAIASAIECNAWRTPIVSPVVNTDDLVEIGRGCSTRVRDHRSHGAGRSRRQKLGLKIRSALARARRVAPRGVLRRRSPASRRRGGRGRALRGGATDFKAQLEKIRDVTPDALFAIGSVENCCRSSPDQVLRPAVAAARPSQWNSDKLMRLRAANSRRGVPRGGALRRNDCNRQGPARSHHDGGRHRREPGGGGRVLRDARGAGSDRKRASSREDVRRYWNRSCAATRPRAANAPTRCRWCACRTASCNRSSAEFCAGR
jgi:hypothetical protein